MIKIKKRTINYSFLSLVTILPCLYAAEDLESESQEESISSNEKEENQIPQKEHDNIVISQFLHIQDLEEESQKESISSNEKEETKVSRKEYDNIIVSQFSRIQDLEEEIKEKNNHITILFEYIQSLKENGNDLLLDIESINSEILINFLYGSADNKSLNKQTSKSIYSAIRSKNLEAIEEHIALKKPLNVQNLQKETPFHLEMSSEILRKLLNTFLPLKPDPAIVSAILEAYLSKLVNFPESLSLLITEFSGEKKYPAVLQAKDYNENTALMAQAAYRGYSKSYFLHQIASRNDLLMLDMYFLTHPSPDLGEKRGQDGFTALHAAARSNRSKVVQKLLEKGAPIDEFDGREGSTPLHWAVFYGHYETTVILLANNANTELEVQNDSFGYKGQTALHLVVSKGNIELIKLLLRNGADKNAVVPLGVKRYPGLTSLEIAQMKGYTMIINMLQQTEWEEEKEEYNMTADMLQQGDYKKEWFEAAILGDKTKLEEILDKHPDIDINMRGTKYRTTALIWSAYQGHLEVVRLLVQQGADQNLRESGKTALEWATTAGQAEVVAFLQNNTN